MTEQVVLSGLFTDVLEAYRAAKGRQADAADRVTDSLAALSDAETQKATANARAAEIIAESDRMAVDAEANRATAVEAEVASRREVLAGLEAVKRTAEAEIETVKASLGMSDEGSTEDPPVDGS